VTRLSSPRVAGVGDVLGPYRIEALLGEGGMGRVFRATHAQTGQVVALEVLKPGLAGDTEHTRRLLREARDARLRATGRRPPLPMLD
jgi:serine/threonine protein kinase